MKRIAALILLAAGIAVFAIGDPGVDRKVDRASERLDAELASRERHIDPAELLALMHDRRIELEILDVRAEADYNLFHLDGARRVPPGDAGIRWIERLPAGAVKVVVDSTESRAATVWKRARAVGTQNLYILAGGTERWLSLYRERAPQRAIVPAAIGDRHDASRPPADWLAGRDYVEKVEIVAPAAGPAGGCGG